MAFWPFAERDLNLCGDVVKYLGRLLKHKRVQLDQKVQIVSMALSQPQPQ